ncbi:hypothetical protein Tco_1045781 [Tanacetum coccineum]|uniref:Uncharacterized protein n=1 Tax=Tanacetum coccineum TaxID=301880 RepID=A0ABQ5GTT3_9ASTR
MTGIPEEMAAFENGISESFNRAILEPRHKPIITMLEEIRLYIMQRLVAMNKIATNLQDTITPSIRKRCSTESLRGPQGEIERMAGHSQWFPKRFGKLGTMIKLWCNPATQGVKVDVEVKMKPVLVEWVVLMKQVWRRRGTRGRGKVGSNVESSVEGRRVVLEGNRAVGSTRGGMAGSSSMGLLTSEEESIHVLNTTQQSGVWVKDAIDVTTEYVDEFPEMWKSSENNVMWLQEWKTAMEEKFACTAIV